MKKQTNPPFSKKKKKKERKKQEKKKKTRKTTTKKRIIAGFKKIAKMIRSLSVMACRILANGLHTSKSRWYEVEGCGGEGRGEAAAIRL